MTEGDDGKYLESPNNWKDEALEKPKGYFKTEVISSEPNSLGMIKDPVFANYLSEISTHYREHPEQLGRITEDDHLDGYICNRMELEITLQALPLWTEELKGKLNPKKDDIMRLWPRHTKPDIDYFDRIVAVAVNLEYSRYLRLMNALKKAKENGISIENKTAEQLIEEVEKSN